MGSNTDTMAGPGRNPKVSDDEILKVLRSGIRPVWSASDLKDVVDLSRQTAHNRLKKLEQSNPGVEKVKVGKANAYYVPGVASGKPDSDPSMEKYHKRSLKQWAEDRFVGLGTRPWTAVHPNDGPAEAGDKVQLKVTGTPEKWSVFRKYTWDRRRNELDSDETSPTETQALVSGKLYSKPTTPIEHRGYPDDYDLESKLGVERRETDKGSFLIATGEKSYLIKPCNDAVFLTDVDIDFISLKDPDHDPAPVAGFDYEDLVDDEELEEWRDDER